MRLEMSGELNFDLRELSARFARLRFPARVLSAGIAIVMGILAAALLVKYPSEIFTLQPLSSARSALPLIATIACLMGVGFGCWSLLRGLRRVAMSVSCNAHGLTFGFDGGRTRAISWPDAISKLNIHDWRESAERRNIPATFALNARWGPWIIAILTPEAFDGITKFADVRGISAVRGRVNKWLTGDPLSTVVYRFVRKT